MSKMKNARIQLIIHIIVIILLLGSPLEIHRASAQSDEKSISNDIIELETTILSIYKIVKTSKNKSLVIDVNTILEIITDAKMYLKTGDLESASQKIISAKLLSTTLIDRSNDISKDTIENKISNHKKQDLVTGVFILVVVLSGYLAWRYFERVHYRDILTKKPEISTDEA